MDKARFSFSHSDSRKPALDKQVLVDHLTVGMFICKLDRPWTDTPFILQGFLLHKPEEIELLRKYCQYVFVDPLRSTVRMSSASDEEPAAKKGDSLVKKFLGLLSRPRKETKPAEPADEELRALDAHAVIQTGPRGLSASPNLAQARHVYQDSKEVLSEILQDIRRGRTPQVIQASEVVNGIIDSVTANPQALFWLTQLRMANRQVYYQNINTAVHMISFGRHLSYPSYQLSTLGLAGLLKDVGLVDAPEDLWGQKRGLNPDQFETLKKHIAQGIEILRTVPSLPHEVLAVIRQHHERYTQGLDTRGKLDQVQTFAEIADIADTFEGLINPRLSVPAATVNNALQKLYIERGKCFHPALIERFIQSIGLFPVGTLVELNSGEVAIVIAQNRVRRLKPRVLVLLDADKKPYRAPILLDLIQDPVWENGAPYSIVQDLAPGSHGIVPKEICL